MASFIPGKKALPQEFFCVIIVIFIFHIKFPKSKSTAAGFGAALDAFDDQILALVVIEKHKSSLKMLRTPE